MSTDRRDQLLTLLAVHHGAPAVLRGVCGLYVSELAVTGAWMRVLGGLRADDSGAIVCATDPVGARLDDLHQTVGQGPCVDAFKWNEPVLVPDLTSQPTRWPGFTAPAANAGVAAVFAFCLRVDVVRLGVVGLYRDVPGPLPPHGMLDAFLLAEVATEAIVGDQPMTLPGLVDIQAGVHQACGIVAVQLEVPLPEALLRIRAYAFAHDLTLAEVANGIIGRRMRLDPGE